MNNTDYWNGHGAAHRRIMYKGAGYSDEDIRHKPHIGVANTFTDASPATAHLRLLADAVKQGVWSAGGVPFEFGVPGLCGNIAVGHENCRYELAERDVVCSAIEIVSKINHFDGLVTLSSWDDILAGFLMGVGRVNIPAVMVTGGPMMPGCYEGNQVLAPDIEEFEFAGTTPSDFSALEDAACQALVGLGLHQSVGLVTDGRFSGFNHGPIVGHISPEAFEGGPLALVRDGDQISVDVDNRILEIDLSEKELADRRSGWQQPDSKVKSGWLALYAANCRPASEGAAMQPW